MLQTWFVLRTLPLLGLSAIMSLYLLFESSRRPGSCPPAVGLHFDGLLFGFGGFAESLLAVLSFLRCALGELPKQPGEKRHNVAGGSAGINRQFQVVSVSAILDRLPDAELDGNAQAVKLPLGLRGVLNGAFAPAVD